MIGDPLSAPGVKVTVALLSPRVAVPIVGASGTATGTTAFVRAESGPVPTAFVALTEHLYVLSFVKPVTRIGLDVPVCEPGSPPSKELHEAVRLVTALPLSNGGPLKVGTVNTTWAERLPAFAVAFAGASGTRACTNVFDAAEGWLVPEPFVAVTVHV